MGRWERPLCFIGRSLQKQQNPDPLHASLLRCASNRASVTVRRARKVTLISAASFDLLTFVGGVRRIVGESTGLTGSYQLAGRLSPDKRFLSFKVYPR